MRQGYPLQSARVEDTRVLTSFNEINPTALGRRLVPLVLDNPQHVVLGKEPVLHQGNGVGHVTSAYFGHTIGKQLAYAWVPAN